VVVFVVDCGGSVDAAGFFDVAEHGFEVVVFHAAEGSEAVVVVRRVWLMCECYAV